MGRYSLLPEIDRITPLPSKVLVVDSQSVHLTDSPILVAQSKEASLWRVVILAVGPDCGDLKMGDVIAMRAQPRHKVFMNIDHERRVFVCEKKHLTAGVGRIEWTGQPSELALKIMNEGLE